MKLWTFIKEHMLLNPTQEICENNASMTYEDVVIWAESFSGTLKNHSCCAIMCSSEMAAAMALLSCFAAGVTAVPLSVRYGKAHCNKILSSISPDAIIMDNSGELEVYNITDSQYVKPAEHPALIMCTSGTTGVPKGAMLSEKNIITNVTDIADYFAIENDDTILIARPIYHCAVLTGEFLTALIKGTKIRFYSEQFNPVKILTIIRQYDITAFCGTPTLLSMMAKFKRNSAKNSLKHICISGECMSKEVGKRIKEAFNDAYIYSIYGLTEACPRVSYLPPEYFCEYADFVGIPLKSVSLKILLKDGTEAEREQTGILWVKGDNVMLGYYNNPQKTAEILKDGWLCTGDLAMINNSGFLKIMGRNDDMIIKAGMNIYPQEIEGALKCDPRVMEALVYAENDERFGVQLVLNIVGDFADSKEVKELCQKVLPVFQVPNKINLLAELPKNGSGKIIRRKAV